MSSIKYLSRGEAYKVFIVSENLDLMLYPVEIYFPLSICLNYYKEFLVIYFIVKFGFREFPREVSDRI